MNKLDYFFHMKLYHFEIYKKEKVLSLGVQFFLKFLLTLVYNVLVSGVQLLKEK